MNTFLKFHLLDFLREQNEQGIPSPKKAEIQSCAWKILKVSVLEEVKTFICQAT